MAVTYGGRWKVVTTMPTFVPEVAEEGGKVVGGGNRAGERVVRAAGVAVGRWVCAGSGLRQAEAVAIQFSRYTRPLEHFE